MPGTFKFYSDSGLTTPITPLAMRQIILNDDGSSGNVDFRVWFGSTNSAMMVKASSNPGVDQISVSVADSSPSTGQPAALLVVATDSADLGTATQSVDIGTTIPGGAVNAVPVWVRANISLGNNTAGTYTDLYLTTNDLSEALI